MPSPSSSAASTASAAAMNEERRRQILEQGALQFTIKTGGARYICRVMDRPTLERARSSRSTTGTIGSVGTESPAESPVESGANSFVSK